MEKSDCSLTGDQNFHPQLNQTNITASRYDIPRRTQHHLCGLARNAQPESNHEETSGKGSIQKSRGGRIVSFKIITIIKDKEGLGKCSKLKEAKEMWQLHAEPDPRLHPVLESRDWGAGGALNVIIGSVDKIGTCIIEDHVNVKFTKVSNCSCYITLVM